MYSFSEIGFHMLGDCLKDEIHKWCEPYLYRDNSVFKVLITPPGEIIIHTPGLLHWDETLHNRFCEEFNLILFKVNSVTDYYTNDNKNYINLHYGFVSTERDKFKDYSLDWDSFALNEPTSLKYVNEEVMEIRKTIRSLIDEYLEVNSQECPDYKIKLEALYELDRRIR